LTGAGHLVKMFRGSIDTETAVFSQFRYRQSPFVGSIWLNKRSYPMAAFTLSGVKGACRKRTPVSCMTAFEIAGATSGVDI